MMRRRDGWQAAKKTCNAMHHYGVVRDASNRSRTCALDGEHEPGTTTLIRFESVPGRETRRRRRRGREEEDEIGR